MSRRIYFFKCFRIDSYVWSPSIGLSSSLGNSVVATPNTSTLYTITGTDLNGCSDNISSNIIVNPSPSLSLNPNSSIICKGESIQVEVFGQILIYGLLLLD